MKAVFLYLAFANALDGIFSYIGLRLSLIEEMNPLMEVVYLLDPVLFLLLKGSLSIVILTCLFSKSLCDSAGVRIVSVVAVAAYTAVIGMHFFWIYHSF